MTVDVRGLSVPTSSALPAEGDVTRVVPVPLRGLLRKDSRFAICLDAGRGPGSFATSQVKAGG